MAEPGKESACGRQVSSAMIQLLGCTRPFQLWNTDLSLHTAQGIVSGSTYPVLLPGRQIETILDVGANVGASTVFFALNYPQATVLAFEPSPDSFALLEANTRDLAKVCRFNFGLGGHDASLPLYQGQLDCVTNSFCQSTHNTSRHVMARMRDAQSVLIENRVERLDLLKLDTEGCELSILRSLRKWLSEIRVLYIEYHDEADRREIDRMLSPTHSLCRCTVREPHRGDLTYVRADFVPASIANARIAAWDAGTENPRTNNLHHLSQDGLQPVSILPPTG